MINRVLGLILISFAIVYASKITEIKFPDGNSNFGLNYDKGSVRTSAVNNAQVYWELNALQFKVPKGNIYFVGKYNSFCDIPSISELSGRTDLEKKIPSFEIGQAFYAEIQNGDSKIYTRLWTFDRVSSDSIIFLTDSAQSVSEEPSPCAPIVHKVNPNHPYTIGSKIHLKGNYLGLSKSEVIVRVGEFYCDEVEMVIPNMLLSCIIKGSGSDVLVTVSVGNKQSTSSVKVSFSDECNLQCEDDEIPDEDCHNCVVYKFQSNSNEENEQEARLHDGTHVGVELNELVYNIIFDQSMGHLASDATFLEIANRYLQSDDLRNYPIPKFELVNTQIDLVARVEIDEKGFPRLFGLEDGITPDVLSTFTFNIKKDFAKWVATTDEQGNTAYQLDLNQ